MPVIFFILVMVQAFAQENCNPLELEKMCFAEICKVPDKNLIFQDPAVLNSEARKETFVLPKDVSKNIDTIISLTKKIQNDVRGAFKEDDLKNLSQNILTYPGFGETFIQSFFSSSIKCQKSDGKCSAINNDMDPYGSKLKDIYPKIVEYAELQTGMDLLMPEQRAVYLLKALDKISHLHDKNFIKAQMDLIAKNKLDPNESSWVKEFQEFAKKDLEQHSAELQNLISKRTSELLSKEYSKKDITESCRVNEYLRKEMQKASGPEELKKLTQKASDDFKNLFLPRLSSHSRKVLEEKLRSDIFRPVELEKQSIAPHFQLLADVLKQYQRPNNLGKMLQSLSILPAKDKLECNLAGLSPKDYFQFADERVYVSLYTVANNASEAVTHELGHWLSNILKQKKLSEGSSKTLNKLQTCVRNFYEFPNNESLAEEDFADWISSQTNYKGKLHCDIERLVMSVKGQKQSMYEPVYDENSHSGQLFRELNIRINKGMAVPQKCREMMDAYPEFAPKKCELK